MSNQPLRSLRMRVAAISVATLFAVSALFIAGILTSLSGIRENKNAIEVAYSNMILGQCGKDERNNFDLLDGQVVFKQLFENARDVAEEVRKHLEEKYGLSNIPSDSVLRRDKRFLDLSMQTVLGEKKEGYTVVYSNNFDMTTHPQKQLIGQNVRKKADEANGLLLWWRIFGGAVLDNETKQGFYLWSEANGDTTIKFMVCHPIKGTRLVVAATYYPVIDNQFEVVESTKAVAKTLLDLDHSISRQAYVIMPIGLLTVLAMVTSIFWLFGIHAKNIDKEQKRLERKSRCELVEDKLTPYRHKIGGAFAKIVMRLDNCHSHVKGSAQSPEVDFAVDELNLAKSIAKRNANEARKANEKSKELSRGRRTSQFDLLEDINAIVKRLNDGSSIRTIFASGLEAAPVAAVRDDVRYILEEIHENAVRALHESSDGVLSIRLFATKLNGRSAFCLDACDNGPGFENPCKAIIPHETTCETKGGTGLGLAIIERKVLRSDGDIAIDNQKSGARVRVWLPAVERKRDKFGFKFRRSLRKFARAFTRSRNSKFGVEFNNA